MREPKPLYIDQGDVLAKRVEQLKIDAKKIWLDSL